MLQEGLSVGRVPEVNLKFQLRIFTAYKTISISYTKVSYSYVLEYRRFVDPDFLGSALGEHLNFLGSDFCVIHRKPRTAPFALTNVIIVGQLLLRYPTTS